VSTGKQRFKFGGIAMVLFVLVVFLLQSCGDNGLGGGIGGTGIIVQGIMTKGSVKVADKTFDASGADIVEDDTSATEDKLQDGMKVHLKGVISDDGASGTAFVIEAEDEVQGRVSSLDALGNPPFFKILQQNIFTDDRTVFSNFPGPDPDGITDMENDQFVEVHGQRDANNNIRATRVELLAAVGEPDPEESELKGLVSGLSGFTFFIGLQEIDFSGALVEPMGATINNGDFVEVEGNLNGSVLEASKVEREDLEDEEFDPVEGDEIEIEGFVSEFTVHPGDFKVDGRPVRTTLSTEFENGSDEDLRNGVEVEAEGHWSASDGTLLVEEIDFKRVRIKINAEATAASSTGVTVLGLNIQINDLTEIDPDILPLSSGTFYEIEGFQDTSGNIIAEEIEDGDSGRILLQANVVSKNDASDTVTLLNAPWSTLIDLSTVTEFEDDDENQLAGVDAFLALVTPGKTVIKVRDDDLDTNWDNAELED
jgi:hypothetical protein